MKKITILALHLGYGGIEKCISNLANSLVDDYEIEVVATYKLYDKPAFYFNDKICIKYLTELKPNKKEIKDNLASLHFIELCKELIKAKKILKLKKSLMINYIRNCDSDIIISTRDIHNLWLSKYGSSSALRIGWEHNYHNNNKKYINEIVKSVYGLDYFVLVSKELRDFYSSKVKPKCVYIPNSIVSIPKKTSSLQNNNIISVGRLSSEKGFIDLIDIFKLVHDRCPGVKLNIIGDGNEKQKIEKKISEYHLNEYIKLHGFQNSEYIASKLLDSSVYVMTSFTESFGLVIIEASSFGLPCVAFDSAKGVSEIIKDNWDGYLISNRDKEKMAKRIINLINDKNRRIIMGNNAHKKSKDYLASNIKDKWIEIFEKK